MKSNSTQNKFEDRSTYSQFIDSYKEEASKVRSMLDTLEAENFQKSNLLTSKSSFMSRFHDISKSKVEDIDHEIFKVQQRILQQKETISLNKKSDQLARRKIKILEQALQNSQERYNLALSKNKLIHDNIDAVRKDRTIYRELYKGILESINEAKRKMEKMIELGSQTIKNRDIADRRTKELELQANAEDKEFEVNLNELKALMAKEKRIKTEMSGQRSAVRLSPDVKTAESEEDIKKKIIKTSWKIAQDKSNMIMSLNKLEEYEEIIKKFQELTGVSNFESLLKHYQDTKQHNTILSKYVEGLSDELEMLEMQLKNLKEQVSSYNAEREEFNEEPKVFPAAVHSLERFSEQFIEVSQRIEDVYTVVGCRNEGKLDLLSDFEQIEIKIAAIERRCHEVLEVYREFSLKPEKIARTEAKIEVDIPQFQDKDIEDDDIAPLSRQELMKKAEKKYMSKKK